MDRLHSMRVFARVVDEGGFARAARALQLSPAVVTRLVADLEEHLGSRLIHRTTRRLSLTDPGELYLERVRHILGEIDEAEALAASASAPPRGHLRVRCPTAFAVHQLAPLVPRFRALHPRVTIELQLAPAAAPEPDGGDGADDLEDDGAAGRHDVALRIGGDAPVADRVVSRHLARSEVIACAAPEYLARHGRPQRPDDLARHDVMVPASLREAIRRACGDREAGASSGFDPRRAALVSGHVEVLHAAARAGAGIVVLPSYVAAAALLDRTLERVLPHWPLATATVHARVPARGHPPARARVFVDFLARTFGGTERDPWLAAAGCETRTADPPPAAQQPLFDL